MGNPPRLARDQQRALGRLRRLRELKRFYLAGGTAVASHLGHRASMDLDLFSIDGSAVRAGLERAFPSMRVLGESSAVLKIQLGATLVDIVRYRHSPSRGLAPRASPPPGCWTSRR